MKLIQTSLNLNWFRTKLVNCESIQINASISTDSKKTKENHCTYTNLYGIWKKIRSISLVFFLTVFKTLMAYNSININIYVLIFTCLSLKFSIQTNVPTILPYISNAKSGWENVLDYLQSKLLYHIVKLIWIIVYYDNLAIINYWDA